MSNCVNMSAVSFHLLLLVTLVSPLLPFRPKVKTSGVIDGRSGPLCITAPSPPRPLPMIRQRRSEKGARPPLPLQTVVVVF